MDQKKKKKRQRTVLFLLAALTAAAGLIGYINSIPEPEKGESARPVRIIRPSWGSLEKELLLTGYVEAQQMVTVLPRVSGALDEIRVEIGQSVTEGEIIARIDPEPYELTLKQAEAAFSAAESTFLRLETLWKNGAATEESYNQARGAYNAYKSQYELARLNLRYTEIRAPLTGIVLVRHAERGSLVAPQIPLFTLGDLRRLKVTLNAPENYYSLFPPDASGMKARIRVPALEDRQYPAHVRTLAPYVNPANRNFEIIVDFDESDPEPRPGMFVYVSLILEESPPLWSLPWEALVGKDELWYMDGESRARQVTVSPGFSTRDRFVLPDEYSGFDFILEGQHFLKDGTPVRVLE